MLEELVRRAQNGEEEALLQLFQRYETRIYRIAYVCTGNEHDALDVVQEAAYRAFKNIRSLTDPSYFKRWLLKIVLTTTLDLLRKKQVTIEFEDFQIEETYEEQLMLEISLRDVMDQLNEAEKMVVFLKYYEKVSLQDIAQLLNISLGSAKTTLYRALTKVRKWKDEIND